MTNTVRFPYLRHESGRAEATILAYLPLALSHQERSITVSGLLDSGSTVNVLPYSLGLQLGFIWSQQTISVQLTGNLAASTAKGILVKGQVASLPSVDLTFAWTQTDEIPVILGQVNFFMEYDICFHRSIGEFEVKPKPN